MPDLSFGLYSGYIPIQGTNKFYHYVATLSRNDPNKDPVVFWFNGGPGCSSMMGFLFENGPYSIGDNDTEFHQNNYSWNNFSTVVYVESPAGVGFSICNETDQTFCAYDDNSTAAENMQVILDFFKIKFPELSGNELYISGESYSGIYVPWTVSILYDYINQNQGNNDIFKPNLKGFMVGNGVTNFEVDCIPSFVDMSYFHSFYDEETYS